MADDNLHTPAPLKRTSWTEKVAAKPEAIAFYKALEAAHRANVFEECHILHAESGVKKVPMLWDPIRGYARKASLVVAHFLQIDLPGRQQCSTPGCINPTHFGPVDPFTDFSPDFPSERLFPVDLEKTQVMSSIKEQKVPDTPESFISTPPIQEWLDLVEYMRDQRGILHGLTYQEYRDMISAEDISDEYLPTVFDHLPLAWKRDMV